MPERKMVLMQHEGALYRGFAFRFPTEIWNRNLKEWEPYAGAGRFLPVEWGSVITETEAMEQFGWRPPARMIPVPGRPGWGIVGDVGGKDE